LLYSPGQSWTQILLPQPSEWWDYSGAPPCLIEEQILSLNYFSPVSEYLTNDYKNSCNTTILYNYF
jgi:hypothetical protein